MKSLTWHAKGRRSENGDRKPWKKGVARPPSLFLLFERRKCSNRIFMAVVGSDPVSVCLPLLCFFFRWTQEFAVAQSE